MVCGLSGDSADTVLRGDGMHCSCRGPCPAALPGWGARGLQITRCVMIACRHAHPPLRGLSRPPTLVGCAPPTPPGRHKLAQRTRGLAWPGGTCLLGPAHGGARPGLAVQGAATCAASTSAGATSPFQPKPLPSLAARAQAATESLTLAAQAEAQRRGPCCGPAPSRPCGGPAPSRAPSHARNRAQPGGP